MVHAARYVARMAELSASASPPASRRVRTTSPGAARLSGYALPADSLGILVPPRGTYARTCTPKLELPRTRAPLRAVWRSHSPARAAARPAGRTRGTALESHNYARDPGCTREAGRGVAGVIGWRILRCLHSPSAAVRPRWSTPPVSPPQGRAAGRTRLNRQADDTGAGGHRRGCCAARRDRTSLPAGPAMVEVGGLATASGTAGEAGPEQGRERSGTGGEGGKLRPPEPRDMAFPFDKPPKELRGVSLNVTFWVRVDGAVERYVVEPEIKDRDYAKKFDEVMRAFRFTPARAPDGTRVAGTTRISFTLPGKSSS